MTDLPLRREDRTMKDPKKQAQAQAQAQAQKRKVTYDDWAEICEHREVVTVDEEMSVYGDYFSKRLYKFLRSALWSLGKQGRISVDAAIKISDEQPVLRLIFNNRRVPDELYGVKCGGGVRILEQSKYVEPNCLIDVVFNRLVRKFSTRAFLEYGHDFEASYIKLPPKLSLKVAINVSLSFLAKEYDYVNLPEDGIL